MAIDLIRPSRLDAIAVGVHDVLAALRDRLPLDDPDRHDVDPDDEALRLAGLAHPERIPDSDWTPGGGA